MNYYRRGDVVMVRGRGLIARAIRILTRRPGEEESRANHVAIVSRDGWLYPDGEEPQAMIIEAAPQGIMERPLADHAGCGVVVYRKAIDDPEMSSLDRALLRAFADPDVAASKARLMVGTSYPWWRILAHFLDLLLFDAYIFRRVLRSSEQMECSYLVAWAYGLKMDYRPSWATTPDDIDDWMRKHPAVWEVAQGFGILDEDNERGSE